MLFDLIKPDLRVAFGFAGMHPSPSLYCLPHYYSYPSGDFLVCEEDVPFDRSRLERGETCEENDVWHLGSIRRELSNFNSKICIRNIDNGRRHHWEAALWAAASWEAHLLCLE